MGMGTDLARDGSPEHAAMMDNFKEQFLLALVKRFGPELDIPVSEIDATGGYLMMMQVVQTPDGPAFRFKVEPKQ